MAVHESRLGDGDCMYQIIVQDGAPAGYAILRGLKSENHSIELKRIVVAEPGRGLGRQVLRAILAAAFRDLAAHRLWLDVFADNTRARHLYRSVGFVEEGVLRESVKRNDEYRSLVVMSMLENEYRGL